MTPLLLLYQVAMTVGGWWCHQLPARSPHLFGLQMPACWRCTGILIGAASLLVWLLKTKRVPPLVLCLLAALLLPLDVLYSVAAGDGGDNTRRLLTGLLWGFFATGAALRLTATLSARLARRSPRNSRREPPVERVVRA